MFELVESVPAAEPVFAAARKRLGGRDPRDLVRTASLGELHTNRTAQLLCGAQALAIWICLKAAIPGPLTIAGYSAGELTAWGVAAALDIDTTIELIAMRADFMDRAAPADTGLAAVLGLGRQAVDELCSRHGTFIAIINADDHFLIGGHVADLTAALEEARARGAVHLTRMPISLASHTPLLRGAGDAFHAALVERLSNSRLPFGRRLLSGVDGEPVMRIDEGLVKLAMQVEQAIDWAACMATCIASGPRCVVELGPGDGLARMFTQFSPSLHVRSVAAFRSLNGVEDWLRRLF